jgi:hypothetical protein
MRASVALALSALVTALAVSSAPFSAEEQARGDLPFSVDDEKKFIEASTIIERHGYWHWYNGSGPGHPQNEIEFVLCADDSGYSVETWNTDIERRSVISRRSWGELASRLPAAETTSDPKDIAKIKLDGQTHDANVFVRKRNKDSHERIALHKDFPGIALQYDVYEVAITWRWTVTALAKGKDADNWREKHLAKSPWRVADARQSLVAGLTWRYRVTGARTGTVTCSVKSADENYVDLEEVFDLQSLKQTNRVKRRLSDCVPYLRSEDRTPSRENVKVRAAGADWDCAKFELESYADFAGEVSLVAIKKMPLVFAEIRHGKGDSAEKWELETLTVPEGK